jgi:hypothetical protein
LKKRTKKLLPVAYAAGDSATAGQKFFASFFQKRRFFLRAPFKTWHGESDGVRF